MTAPPVLPELDHVFVVTLVTTEGVTLPQEIHYTPQGVMARIDGDPTIYEADCWYIPERGADPVHKFHIGGDTMTVDEEQK